jgi:hypothetical protein
MFPPNALSAILFFAGMRSRRDDLGSPGTARVVWLSGSLAGTPVPEQPLRAYNHGVRVKTSITLPADLLERVDRMDSNRSAFLERAALLYLSRLEQSRRDRRDIAIINRHARRLNRGVQEILKYQTLP